MAAVSSNTSSEKDICEAKEIGDVSKRASNICKKSSLFPFSPTFFSYQAQAFVTIVLVCDCTLCGPKIWLIVNIGNRGGLAATFDLAAFALYMIAPVKKSVNHSKTLTSMREVQRSLARTTREYLVFFWFVVTRLWKRNLFFVIVYLLLVFLATVQRLGTTFL